MACRLARTRWCAARGSKPPLLGLLLAIGADVALPRPSRVSYAALAAMIGNHAHLVPVPPGEDGIPIRPPRRHGRGSGR